jgi:hypothetical protein
MNELDDEVSERHEADRIMKADLLNTAFEMGTAPVAVEVGSPLREAMDGWKAARHPRICPHYLDPFWMVMLPSPGIRCRKCLVAALGDGTAGGHHCAGCGQPVTDAAYLDHGVEDGVWFIARFCSDCYDGSDQ